VVFFDNGQHEIVQILDRCEITLVGNFLADYSHKVCVEHEQTKRRQLAEFNLAERLGATRNVLYATRKFRLGLPCEAPQRLRL
jgi:hypothetical protein